MKNNVRLKLSYDDLTDVLYVSALRSVSTKNMEDVAGLVLRYDLRTHDPVGATILDYKHHWLPRRRDLAARLADFFHISTNEADRALESVDG
jgi:hypothetical protein